MKIPGSKIENKLILILAEDQCTDEEGDDAENRAPKVGGRLGSLLVHQDLTDKLNHVIQGVESVDRHKVGGNDGIGVEDRGEIHQQHGEDIPQELGIAEEYHHGGKDQSHAVAEQEQHDQGEGQQQSRGRNKGSRNDA